MKSDRSEILFNIDTVEERVEVSFSADAEPGMGRRCEARLDIFGIQESAARCWPLLQVAYRAAGLEHPVLGSRPAKR